MINIVWSKTSLKVVIALLMNLHLMTAIGLCNDKQELARAVHLYQTQNYEEARIIFETLNQSRHSSGLFFNLGNCYVRLGKIGQGIGAYYSALKRSPNNAEIKHNLVYAASFTGANALMSQSERGLKSIFINIIRHFSLRRHQIGFLFLFVIFGFIYTYFVVRKKSLFQRNWLLGLMLVFLILDASTLKISHNDSKRTEGVVILQNASVRYGPSLDDTEAFLLPEGTLLGIRSDSGEWSQIQLYDGKVGWLQKQDFVIIL